MLELWAEDGQFSEEVFDSLTEQDILQAVNTKNKSGLFNINKVTVKL